MAAKKVYVGEVGNVLELDVNENVSTAQTITVFFVRSDGSKFNGSGSVKQGTTDVVEYTFATGNLTIAGTYRVQVKASWANGNLAWSDTCSVHVESTLE